jgi:radical SAM protein (TIGR01212 family)
MVTRYYYDLNSYFRDLFGQRVHKISVDAGFNCPNRDGTISTGGCIYCNERGSGTGAYTRGLSIAKQLEMGKVKVSRRFKAKKFLAYFQSYTNTYAPFKVLKKAFDDALGVTDVVGLSIGTRPDCVDELILNLLSSYTATHLIWLEYGLQSCHDDTLNIINRGHDFICFKSAVKATLNRNIKICVHVILGLPGEDRIKILESAKAIAEMGLDGIKLHLLYVVKGTRLHDLYIQGNYRCLEQAEYVELVCEFLELLPQKMVIHRLTGDPHPTELVEPHWALDKYATLDLIKKRFKSCHSYQGKYYRQTFS